MGDETSDEILMAAYQAGNDAAFRQLFDRHAGSVYGFVVRRVGDRALAEDLFQEVFLRVHRGRQTFDAKRSFRAWLFGIVHNSLVDALRRRGRAPESLSLEYPEIAADDAAPEEQVAARQSALALERALGSLASDEATALVLARFEGLSYEDIGTILGRSSAASKQLAYRALKRVRAAMTAAGYREVP